MRMTRLDMSGKRSTWSMQGGSFTASAASRIQMLSSESAQVISQQETAHTCWHSDSLPRIYIHWLNAVCLPATFKRLAMLMGTRTKLFRCPPTVLPPHVMSPRRCAWSIADTALALVYPHRIPLGAVPPDPSTTTQCLDGGKSAHLQCLADRHGAQGVCS
jgi:hypothetical protein